MKSVCNNFECADEFPRIVSYASLSKLEYPVWLVDIWGTLMFDEARLNAPLLRAMHDYRRGGGLVALVTNSGRSAAVVTAQLAALGCDSARFFDVCVSGGDLGRTALATYDEAKILWLDDWLENPESAVDIDAVTVAVVGLRPCAARGLDKVAGFLRVLASRRIPLLCLNPDLCLANDGELEFCAGIVAGAYEALGGSVTYFGKPFPAIFSHAIAALSAATGSGSLVPSDALVIGDTLRTDILGGIAVGADTAHVAGAGVPSSSASTPLSYAAAAVSTFTVIDRPDDLN